MRRSITSVAGLVFASMTSVASATFHFMQIEQVIGGVNGDVTAQAIQLRMRSLGQNLVGASRLRAWNAAGQNPVVVVDFTSSVPNGQAGRRVLVATPSFLGKTTPATVDDVAVMVTPIPASYLAAGSLTFESDTGIIYWRLSWGGAAYTGTTTGSIANDADGDFGKWPDPLPTNCNISLLFNGIAGDPSTTNADDYILSSGPAVFTNNGNSAFTINTCAVAADCSDGVSCTTDACAAGCCSFTPNNAICDDGNFCSGTETCLASGCLAGSNPCGGATPFCNEAADACQECNVAGDCNAPVPACVVPTCDAGNCVYTPTNSLCPSDGFFCTGTEFCNLVAGCTSSGDPCGAGELCDEANDECDAAPAAIKLVPVVGGARQAGVPPLVSPLQLTHAGDQSDRLFIVDQVGQIRVVENGLLLATPFLDVSGLLPAMNAGFDERGLLGLAFHPNYATNGKFYIRYSTPRAGNPGEPCVTEPVFTGGHAEVLAQYTVSGNPNVADASSGVVLLSVDKPQWNHNAGHLAFGGDGMLYISFGDGGGANDGLGDVPPSHGPMGNGQSIDSLLGKMLRVDVDGGSPYAVPPSNPFVGAPGLDEIYAYGLRNPYRFSFDAGTGDLYVADAGQNLFEEVNIVTLGGNYGWVIREGFHCFDPNLPNDPPGSCATTGAMGEPLLNPVSEYLHSVPCTMDSECAALGVGCDEGAGQCENEGGLAVIGGYVYRGAMSASLVGKYIYGDFSADFGPTGRLYYFETIGPNAFDRVAFAIELVGDPFGQYLKGFGEDEVGEVYVLASDELGPTGTTGAVYRIEECIPALYGNLVPPDNLVDLDDLVCVLGGFADLSVCPNANIYPCGSTNGVVDVDDLIVLLGAFAGDPSPCPPECL